MKRLACCSLFFLWACSGGGGYLPPRGDLATARDGGPTMAVKDMAGACGQLGDPCCFGNACNEVGTSCQAGLCRACGQAGLNCCAGDVCDPGLACQNNLCVGQPQCGQLGQPCCNGVTCGGGLTCQGGVCSPMMGPAADTGAPCAKASDCAGTMPTCITKDAQGNTWPGGYCTSRCNPQLNDPQTGLNASCPGGNGSCVGSGTTGSCLDACDKGTCRNGYSCFTGGCQPTSLSKCNPTVRGSCGQNMTCVRIGVDDVGDCHAACDVFSQNCAAIMGMATGCYASHETGEGLCVNVFGNGGGNGVPCQYLNSCSAGFGCASEGGGAFCRPFCGGPNNRACNNGKLCKDLSMKVLKNVVGLCSG